MCRFCRRHISHRLIKYMELLKKIMKARSKKRQELLKKAEPCFIKLLCECTLNVLKGRIHLDKRQLKRLGPHAHTMVKVSKVKRHPTKKDKEVLETKGGFLPIILPALISALGTLAGKAVSKLMD